MIRYDFSSLPAHWRVQKLGSVATFLDEQRIPIQEADRANMRGIYPYYGASGIIDYVNDYIFDGDFILLGEDGANILMRSSPLAFRVSGKIWVNNHAHVIQPKGHMDIGFLTEYLESISYVDYNTGTAQPKLPQSTCVKIPVVVPPLAEQRKIAEILSTWDEAIALTERLIAALEQRKRGLMQRLLTGKVRFPQFGMSAANEDPPNEWKSMQLGEVFSRVTREISRQVEHALSITATVGFVDQREKFGRVIAGANLERYIHLLHGEFAYNKGNSISYPQGCVYRLEEFEEGAVPNVYYCFKAKSEHALDLFYKYYFEHGALNQALSRVINTGVRNDGLLNLSAEDFFAVEILVPPLNEQRKIAEVLDIADQELNRQRRRLEALKLQKKGLMQRLLTGEVRVTVEK